MADRNIPTRRGEKSYLSRTKHQKNGSGNYAKWVSQNIEIETFDNVMCYSYFRQVETINQTV